MARGDDIKVSKDGGARTFMAILPAWILFLVLGGALGFLRFYNDGQYLGEYRDKAILGGMIAIGLVHLYVCIRGFSDSMPTGLLCVFIPGYSVYFLFFESDMFYLRAITAALLIGFGYDTGLWVMDAWQEAAETGSGWIGGKREAK